MSSVEGLAATNDDATSCKWSAVQQGYYEDDYITCFCGLSARTRRSAIIHRGYYARVSAFHTMAQQFLVRTGCNAQIVNIGCGYDTTFFRLAAKGMCPYRFLELDRSVVVERKRAAIARRKKLSEVVASAGERYQLHSCDVTDLAAVASAFEAAGIDFSLPTLCVAECVLVYLPPEAAAALIAMTAAQFETVLFLNYEQIEPFDAFGKMMVANLSDRRCPLLGIAAVPTTDAQSQRFLECGFDSATAVDMLSVYHRLPQSDRQRIEALEFLDELEQWQLLMRHYCFVWATKGAVSVQLFGSESE